MAIRMICLFDTADAKFDTAIFDILGDDETLSITDSHLIKFIFTESLNVVDSILKSGTKTLTEIVDIVESVVKTGARNLAESFNLFDSFFVLRYLVETLHLADSLTKSGIKQLSEAISVVDSILKSGIRLLRENLHIIDTIHIVDWFWIKVRRKLSDWLKQDKNTSDWVKTGANDTIDTIEFKRVPYQKNIDILFANNYDNPPSVSVNLCYDFFEPDEHEFTVYDIFPSVKYLIEQIDNVKKYIGVKIIWSGNIDDIDNAYISMIAIDGQSIKYKRKWIESDKEKIVWGKQDKLITSWSKVYK